MTIFWNLLVTIALGTSAGAAFATPQSSTQAKSKSNFQKCFEQSSRAFGARQDAVRVCGTAGNGFESCFKVAKPAFSSPQDAIHACSLATENFDECYAISIREFSSPQDAVRACGNPTW
jgi:hypothetical protein